MILLLRPANGSLNAQKGMRLGSKAPWSPRAGGVIGFVSRVWILPFIFLDFVAPPAPPAKSAGVMHAERHYIKRDHKQTQGSAAKKRRTLSVPLDPLQKRSGQASCHTTCILKGERDDGI